MSRWGKFAVCFFVMSLFISLVFIERGYAVPTARIEEIFEQPESVAPEWIVFEAQQWGDELMHGWETIDGYTIILDVDTWKYADGTKDEHGQLLPSLLIVGVDTPVGIDKHLRPDGVILPSGMGISGVSATGKSSPAILPMGVPPLTGTNIFR